MRSRNAGNTAAPTAVDNQFLDNRIVGDKIKEVVVYPVWCEDIGSPNTEMVNRNHTCDGIGANTVISYKGQPKAVNRKIWSIVNLRAVA